MATDEKDKDETVVHSADPGAGAAAAAKEAADNAGIMGAGAQATGLPVDEGEKTIVKEATRDTLSGPMADLSADGQAQAFQEQGEAKEFVVDERGVGSATAVTKVPLNASADYPGRDKALAATDGGKQMPGNLDAILRAKHAGTPLPGDAQLMSAEEIDALEEAFVTGIEPKTTSGEGIRFAEGDDDPNSIKHEHEVNPNIPTNERARKGLKA